MKINIDGLDVETQRQISQEVCNSVSAYQLLEILPAYVDTGKDHPFNGFWLQILKRNTESIRYIVQYIGDTFSHEEICTPGFERVLHKTYAPNLEEALSQMASWLIDNGLMKNGDKAEERLIQQTTGTSLDCIHQADGICHSAFPEGRKCIKCGEFYL